MHLFLKKYILVFFWIVALTEIISQLFDAPTLHYIFKPLLLPLLITAVFVYTDPSKGRQLIVIGAFFSFLGDVFLLLENRNPNFFIIGLVCFLITHIFYTWYFLHIKKTDISLLKEKPWLILLVLLYTGALIALLFPTLGPLKVPVIIYASVLTMMLLACLRSFRFFNDYSRIPLLTGAICFVVSDSLLAINKFYASFPAAGFLIMLTYCCAQNFILTGFVKNSN